MIEIEELESSNASEELCQSMTDSNTQEDPIESESSFENNVTTSKRKCVLWAVEKVHC